MGWGSACGDSPSPQGCQTTGALLHPLAAFYLSAGWALPLVEDVSADAVPVALQSLLVDAPEMTAGLERYHDTSVGLRVLARTRRDHVYARQVVLTRAADGAPLALAAVALRLEALPVAARAAVLAEGTPLGHIVRRICPTVRRGHEGYFRLQPDPHVRQTLRLDTIPWTYGRRGTLTDTTSPDPVAHVIEVLPPPR